MDEGNPKIRELFRDGTMCCPGYERSLIPKSGTTKEVGHCCRDNLIYNK